MDFDKNKYYIIGNKLICISTKLLNRHSSIYQKNRLANEIFTVKENITEHIIKEENIEEYKKNTNAIIIPNTRSETLTDLYAWIDQNNSNHPIIYPGEFIISENDWKLFESCDFLEDLFNIAKGLSFIRLEKQIAVFFRNEFQYNSLNICVKPKTSNHKIQYWCEK